MWTLGVVPKDWKDWIVFCIPKKGNLAKWDNWREVTLLSVPGKVYCQILLNWITEVEDRKPHEEQAGFIPNCSCVEQIFTFLYTIEKCQELQVYKVISFIAFNRAFDSLHKSSLWKIQHLLVPRKEIKAIEYIYKNSSCCNGQLMAIVTGLRCSLVSVKILFSLPSSLPLQLTGSWRRQQATKMSSGTLAENCQTSILLMIWLHYQTVPTISRTSN